MKIFIFLFLLATSLAEAGLASFYSVKTNGGTATSSGIPFCDHKFTAASRTIANGTKVRVTNLENNKSVVVVITDYGPHKRLKKRVIDLSPVAFRKVCHPKKGLFKCKIEVLK